MILTSGEGKWGGAQPCKVSQGLVKRGGNVKNFGPFPC